MEGYVYFVLSIWTQPQEEDNGIEMYVRKRIAANDVQWFPIGIAHNEDAERFAREAAARGGMSAAAKSASSPSKAAALALLHQHDDASDRDEGGGDSDMEADGAASDANQTRQSRTRRQVDGRDASPSTSPVTVSPKLSRALKSHRKAFVRTDHARDEASTDGTGLKNYIAAAIAELSTRLDTVTAINKAALSDARAGGGGVATPVHSPSWSDDGTSRQSGAVGNMSLASFSHVNSATRSTEVADYSSGPNSVPSTAELDANLGGPSARGGEEASSAAAVPIIRPSVLRATATRPWGNSPYSIHSTSAETISGPSAAGLLHQEGNEMEEKNVAED